MVKTAVATQIEGSTDALLRLRGQARDKAATDWWLESSDLTVLGYAAIAKEVAEHTWVASDTPRVLDWGGGLGFLSFFFHQLDFDTTYYDFSYGDDPAAAFFLDRLPINKMTAEHGWMLPFPNQTFDVVVGCGVLEHVDDMDRSLEEIHRILRPGGLLFLYHFPNRFSYTEFLARRIGQPSHEVLLRRHALVGLVSRHGFQVKSSYYKYMLPRNLVEYPRARHLFTRYSSRLFRIDRALTGVPGLRVVANALNLVAEKPVSG